MKQLQKLWNENQDFKEKSIEQILAWVKNLGEEERKEDLRDLFRIIPLKQIQKYLNECINNKFTENGFVFQDLVNELGIRLGYEVIFGQYRGRKGKNGFDGLWKSKDGHVFVVESKITDTFNINLNTINHYREDLINNKEILNEKSSIILVIGKKNTNAIIEGINGSIYKPIMSTISIDELVYLVERKSKQEQDTILDKQILDALKMDEMVNIDKLVRLMFPRRISYLQETKKMPEAKKFKKKKKECINFYNECVNKINNVKKINICKKEGRSKVLYEDKHNDIGIININSDIKKGEEYDSFWFAYHKYYNNYLEKYKNKYIALGCGSEENILFMPIEFMKKNLDKMNKSENKYNNKIHWHIHINKYKGKVFFMNLPKSQDKWLDISKYSI